MEHGTLTQELWTMTNGTNNFKRRIVSISSCHKADDGTYVFVGKSKLYGPVRDTKNKTDNVRRQHKPAHYE